MFKHTVQFDCFWIFIEWSVWWTQRIWLTCRTLRHVHKFFWWTHITTISRCCRRRIRTEIEYERTVLYCACRIKLKRQFVISHLMFVHYCLKSSLNNCHHHLLMLKNNIEIKLWHLLIVFFLNNLFFIFIICTWPDLLITFFFIEKTQTEWLSLASIS